MLHLNEKLRWRYATKRMNGEKIAPEKLNNILEAIQLAPSSMGLQPFHCFVISDKALLSRIHQKACPQAQIIESSHLIVFATWKKVEEIHIANYIHNIAATRQAPIESLDGFKGMINGAVQQSGENVSNWNARQAYIALGFGLVAAANEQVDATPMEGFKAEALDEILGLKEKNMSSVCLLALGYRDAEKDYLVKAKKVRRNADDLFTKI